MLEAPDQDYTASAKLLAKQAGNRWALLVSGAISSAAGWILPSIGIPSFAPRTLSYIGLALLAWAFFRAFHDVRLQRDELSYRLRPVLELTDEHPASYQYGENEEFGRHHMRRIAVVNSGGTTIEGVRVSLVNIRPDDEGLSPKMPLPLLPQHFVNATPNYTITLAPGEVRPIDLLATTERYPESFLLFHAVRWTDNRIRAVPGDDTYLLDVQAIGRDVPPVIGVFRVWRDKDDEGPRGPHIQRIS